MEKLFKDDGFYVSARYALVSPDDAKSLFLYGCARQVLKASMALMLYEEFTKESPENAPDVERRAMKSATPQFRLSLKKNMA